MTAYLLGPLWLVSRQTVVSAIAVVVLGAYVIWVAGLWRTDGLPGDTRSS